MIVCLFRVIPWKMRFSLVILVLFVRTNPIEPFDLVVIFKVRKTYYHLGMLFKWLILFLLRLNNWLLSSRVKCFLMTYRSVWIIFECLMKCHIYYFFVFSRLAYQVSFHFVLISVFEPNSIEHRRLVNYLILIIIFAREIIPSFLLKLWVNNFSSERVFVNLCFRSSYPTTCLLIFLIVRLSLCLIPSVSTGHCDYFLPRLCQ